MMDTSQNEFGSIPFSAIFWISFRMIGVNCSLKEARIYNGKKTTFLTSGAGQTGQSLVKE